MASFYQSLLASPTATNVAYAQVMAAALAAYATDQTLAGNNYAHTWDGFNTNNPNGAGLDIYNTGANGSVLGLSGSGTTQTVLELLYLTDQAAITPSNFTAPNVAAITAIFSGINGAGGINL